MDLQKQFEAAEKVMAVLDPDGESDWEDDFPEHQETVTIAGHTCLLSYTPRGYWDVWLKGRGTIGGGWNAEDAVAEATLRLDPDAYLEKHKEHKYAVVSANDEQGVTWVYMVTNDGEAAQRYRRVFCVNDDCAEVIYLPSGRLASRV